MDAENTTTEAVAVAQEAAVKVEDQKETAAIGEDDQSGTHINWTDEMKTQFPTSVKDGDPNNNAAAAGDSSAQKIQAETSLPELPNLDDSKKETHTNLNEVKRQVKSEEFELKASQQTSEKQEEPDVVAQQQSSPSLQI